MKKKIKIEKKSKSDLNPKMLSLLRWNTIIFLMEDPFKEEKQEEDEEEDEEEKKKEDDDDE